MKRKNFVLPAITGLATLHLMPGCTKPVELPNILWIVSEDNTLYAGCYGDDFATTPNMDKLAAQGFLYTQAYANAPVSAPSRNTILTGVYANSAGNQHMRSTNRKSDLITPYPLYLREAGYYCTNNNKTDYNIASDQTKGIWDESSRDAHYKNRKQGQPFFAVFNSTISHESSIHTWIPVEDLRHDPQKVTLSPHHPDTPEMRHDYAQYYDKIEEMDAWIGEMLKELDESGEAENTIVFYYGDNGGVLPGSKRFVNERGTHVPFIVRIPEKFKHLFPARKPGTKIDRMISFVDFVPTLLSITGVPVPEYLQGNAFLGEQKTTDPAYAFMFRDRMDERYDMCRAVRDQQFRYIRNYMPYRPWGQHVNYLWKSASMQSWEHAFLNGQCDEIQSRFWMPKPVEELYDMEKDPWEVNNLAGDPAYAATLERMRNACIDWSREIRDTGFLPEAESIVRAGDQPLYDYFHSSQIPLDEIISAANLAISGNPENIAVLTAYLKNSDSGIRYWGATGLLMLGKKATRTIPQLMDALQDTSPNVVVVAAEALYNLGEQEKGLNALQGVLKLSDEFARCHALNAIDCIGTKSPEMQKAVIHLATTQAKGYDLRAATYLMQKWGFDLSEYDIQTN